MAKKQSLRKAKNSKSSDKSSGKAHKVFSTTRQIATIGAPHSVSKAPSANIFPPHLLLSPGLKNKSRSQKTITLETLIPSSVFVARNFFTESECLAWVDYAERQIGFEQVDSPRTRDFAQRECGRIQKTDWNIAATLFDRMRPMMDEIVNCRRHTTNDTPSYRPVACNGNIRIYRYEKGMSFGRHYDGSNAIDRFAGGTTELTVLIYLSSCRGGATRFYPPHQAGGRGKKSKKGIDSEGRGVAFVPEAGSILMHTHGDRCLEHEAEPVMEGIKYVLRTDIVFAIT